MAKGKLKGQQNKQRCTKHYT